ncbi:29825_t:CDS:2, partial [Gigaspora margarita]
MSLPNNINEESTSTVSSEQDSRKKRVDITQQVANTVRKSGHALQDLRPGFKIPGSKSLAGRIFNKQIIQVEVKMESEIQNKNYITL